MPKNCYDLNLDIDPLVGKNSLLDILKITYQTRVPINFINPKLIEFLLSKKIKIRHSEAFYSEPFFVQPIHIDMHGGNITKLNFVFGGANSIMNWYKVKPGVSTPEKLTGAGTIYSEFSLDQVDLVETAVVKFPSLVQVGIPHNIVNVDEPRVCLSLVLGTLDDDIIPIEQVSEILKDYLVPSVGFEPTLNSF